MSLKALLHSEFQSPDEAYFKGMKKGLRQSEYLKMNLFSAASFPIKARICFLVLGVTFIGRHRSARVSF